MNKKNFLRNLLLWIFAVSTIVFPAESAFAQNEWGVENNDDRRREIISRYLSILERRPEEGAIFDRLLQEVGIGNTFEALIEDYRIRSEEDPENVALALLLGHFLKHAERFEEALVAYERAQTAETENSATHLALGRVLRLLDRPEEAVQAYENALTLATDNEENAEILRALTDLAFDAHDWETAATYANRLIALDPDDSFQRMELAELYLRYERYDDALVQYEAIRDQAGRNTRQRAVAMRDIGDVHMLTGNWELAVETYRQAMRLVDRGYWLQRELEQRVVEAYRTANLLPDLIIYYEEEWSRPTFEQLLLLAGLYEELGREEDALEAFETAVRRNRHSVEARMALIRLHERRGETDEVLAQYEGLIDQDPSDWGFRFRMISLLHRLGRQEEALEELEYIADRFDNQPAALVQVADMYARFNLMDRAQEIYEQLVEIAPEDPANYVALGEFYFMDGRRSQADRTWRRILEIIEDEPEAHAQLGEVYQNHSFAEDAVQEFQTAHLLRPEDDTYLRSYARALTSTQQLSQARRQWRTLLDRTEQSHLREEARNEIIRILNRIGILQDELPTFLATAQADPEDIEAAYFLGGAYLELDQLDEAEIVYENILITHPDDLYTLLALERLYTEADRVEEAIEVLLRIAEISPSRAREYYQRLAELSLRLFNDEAALSFSELAISLNPDDASAYARLGGIYSQMQDQENAILAYRQALSLDPRAFTYAFDLAALYLSIGRIDPAEELYIRILTQSNDEADISRAGQRAIQLHDAQNDLLSFAAVLEPLAFRPNLGRIYLNMLVDLYARIVLPLGNIADVGLPDERIAARNRLDSIKVRAMRPVLDALISDDILMRETALDIIYVLQNANAAVPIARLLDGPDETIHFRATIIAGRIGSTGAVPSLIRATQRNDHQVRLAATWALGRCGGEEAIEHLLELTTSQSEEIRAMAILGLGRIQAAQSKNTITAALYDESTLVQTAALWVLLHDPTSTAFNEIHHLLLYGRDELPSFASLALGGMLHSQEEDQREESLSTLLDAYIHGQTRIRVPIAIALSSPNSISWREYWQMRENAFDESGAFYHLNNSTFDVRRYFSLGLHYLLLYDQGDASRLSSMFPALEQALIDGLSTYRSQERVLNDLIVVENGLALRAVRTIIAENTQLPLWSMLASSEPLAEAILSLANSRDVYTRRSVARLVGGFQLERRQEVLDLLADPDREVIRQTIRSIGLAAQNEYVAEILNFTTHETWQLRAEAVRALASLSDPTSAEILFAIWQTDQYNLVRFAALESLLKIDPERILTIENQDELSVHEQQIIQQADLN